TRVRDERRLRDPGAEDARVDLHADEEEVEREADLGGAREQRYDVGREEEALRGRPDRAEERRPEQDAGEHLTHHARLAEPRRHRADEPRREQHGRDREHQSAERLLARARRRLLRARARRGQRAREPRGELPAAERPRELLTRQTEVEREDACAREAADVAAQVAAADAELPARAAAQVDELAGLDELEVAAETGGARGPEAGDGRRRVPAAPERERDR